MAEASWPSPDNGRVVDEIQYEQMCMHYTEDGLYMNPNGAFLDLVGGPVYADSSTPMNVKVRANQLGNVRGFGWTSGDTDLTLLVDSNSSGATRIDRVVLELDRATWNVRAKIVKGTAGAGKPALTRDEGPTGVFQVPVATVTVANNATSIPANNVYVGGLRIGSRVRAWVNTQDMFDGYPKMGELGFNYTTRNWMGFDGTGIREIGDVSGLIPLSINGSDGAAWTKNHLCYLQENSGIIRVRFSVKRWSKSALSASDETGSIPFRLPAAYAPPRDEPGFAFTTYGRGGPAGVRAEPSGDIRIWALDKDLPANGTVFGSVSWFRHG